MEIETQPSATRSASLAVFATDGELLMRYDRHRDQAAFAQVVERHGRLVWIVCKQALRHHQDVEDAFQATFLILAQRATTIRASDSAAAWLYRVAQRTAIAARRRRARMREEALTAEPPQGEEALPVIHDRQMLRVLMEELQSLPQKYQMPLVMQYFEGQSRRAIAEQTDSTLAQIQGRLVRGKRMLRSRLMRRGVSLSLATGAIATASTAASAAVSPSLVAATAASSSVIIASGATVAASSAAVEISKQGLNAMWYASLPKSVSVVAGVFVVAGTLWAAQQGDGRSADATTSGAAANGIDLGAVAIDVDVAEELAPVAIAATEPTQAGEESPEDLAESDTDSARRRELERNHWLLKAKAYRMKAELMRAMVDNATAPTINVADAMLLEADADMAEAKAIELARAAIPGATPAAQDLPAGKANTANLNLWGGKSSPAAQNAAPGELKVFNLLNSDASALVEMLQTQFGTGTLKFSADARNNRIVANGPASDLAVVEALLMRLDSDGDSRQDLRDKQKEENTRHIQELKEQLTAYAQESAANARRLEQEQLERELLQRELDHLHEDYLQLNSPIAAVSGADVNGTNLKGKELEQLKDEIQKSMGNTKAQLEERINIGSQFETDLENVRLQRSAIEKQLEFLERANLQLAYPQETPPDVTIGAGSLRTQTPHLENELSFSNAPPSDPNIVAASMGDIEKVRGENAQLRAMVEKLSQELNRAQSNFRPPANPRQATVAPGDSLRIEALNVSPEAPITGEYSVEAEGAVALGPQYGRVNIAGLSVLEAEERIQRHLEGTFENPSVQVVQMTRRDATTDPFGQSPPPTSAADPFAANPSNTFVPARLSPEQFQTAAAAQFDRLNQMLMALEKENADLKKQVEELRKAQPSGVE